MFKNLSSSLSEKSQNSLAGAAICRIRLKVFFGIAAKKPQNNTVSATCKSNPLHENMLGAAYPLVLEFESSGTYFIHISRIRIGN